MPASKEYQVIVTTCNKSDWTLQAFAYLFNIYYSASQKVHIVCESIPDLKLPSNFIFHQSRIPGIKKGWPRQQWTNGLISYLESIKEQYVLIMLDDYWINRTVDIRGIGTLHEYMTIHKDVLRIDLTGDRLYAQGIEDIDSYGHYDLIAAHGSQYQMSLMPGLWNKQLLLEILQPNWTPWEVELSGTSLVNDRPELIVLGTRQWPLRIVNALRDSHNNVDTTGIEYDHLDYLTNKGWIHNPAVDV